MQKRTFLSSVIILLILYGCNGINKLKDKLSKAAPYEKYLSSLKQAKLDKTLMARLWMQAGERALNDSIKVSLPFSESGYFLSTDPEARSYRFQAAEGQVITVATSLVKNSQSDLFLDLFGKENNEWISIAHADSSLNLTFEVEKSYEEYLIRIQPELLLTAYYSISISLTPVLTNPVAGASNKSIGSFYGDPREGGKRSHEGVDIFAKKGTPVIAPTAGYVSRIGTSRLGGKVVWMQDLKRNHSYYFAHLDEQLVKAGEKLNPGDTIGTVGNTGNARTTPPHLHFGIYQSGSKDPIHYIRTLDKIAGILPWDTMLVNANFKIRTDNVSLRCGPDEKCQKLESLRRDTYVKVIAKSGDWLHVSLPDRSQGFIQEAKAIVLEHGRKHKLKASGILYSNASSEAIPLIRLKPSTVVEVLAHFNSYTFVRTRDGLFGWP